MEYYTDLIIFMPVAAAVYGLLAWGITEASINYTDRKGNK